VGHPEVKVVEPGGLDGDGDVAFLEWLPGALAKPDSSGSERFLVLGGKSFAADHQVDRHLLASHPIITIAFTIRLRRDPSLWWGDRPRA
jgi:hypothetical protein